ncbi:MBL fold metallo-hydrolase [Blautia sp. JLR.GB0024]|uniref:MBL fold metallo-hydrolase n=1 Tax=Blautia sp. JLR.GB0024 TaxID=3123295 RepID=UPI003006C4BA
MRLKVLGSGSSGNCYILENDTEALIIEAGVPFMEVKKELDFNIKKIKAVIITHIHSDHHFHWFKYVRAGIPVFEPFRNGEQALEFSHSEFKIQAFPNQDKDGKWLHGNNDGTECPCYGFYIQHPDIGSLVYVTDTEYVRWRFSEVNHILVEANYCEELIDRNSPKYRHVLEGHMSIDTACRFLKTNNNPALRSAVLLHLSENSANADIFKARVENVVKCPVNVARKGLEIELGLPF